jgi:hypothetical protein
MNKKLSLAGWVGVEGPAEGLTISESDKPVDKRQAAEGSMCSREFPDHSAGAKPIQAPTAYAPKTWESLRSACAWFALTTSPSVRCALELDLPQQGYASALRGIKQRLQQEEKFPRLG